jgi:Zn-dependent M28 family amino/carboxypeptidase
MKKLSFLLAVLALATSTFAQTNDASKYASIISGSNLKKHLTIIAGDDFEGRETGTEGQRKAAAYIESHFKNIGLTQVAALKGYQQFYPLYKDSLISSSLLLGDYTATYGTDYITPANTNENAKFKGKKIVFLGYGIESPNYTDYNNVDVKGKVVIFFLGEPKKDGNYVVSGTKRSSEWSFPGLSKKLALAASKGAVGAFVINPNQEIFTQTAINNSNKTNVYFPRGGADKTINYAIITHAMAKNIVGESFDFASYLASAKASEPFKINGFEKKFKSSLAIEKYRLTVNASNVVGFVEGSDKKDEYVFVTGHYDHLGKHDGKIYYGADDDGSGTVAVMMMAEAFAKAKAEGKGPRRTMVFMTVSGEEKGLWGSEYYSDHPFFPIEKTSVDLNIDMIGRIDTERKKEDTMNYVYVVGHDKISSELPIINEGENNKYTKLTLDYKFDDPNDPNRIYFRSDHYNFARKGIPVLFFYDGMLKSDYHRPTDTVDKITWDLYEKRAQMVFYTAWAMANKEAMLVRDKPLPTATR